MPIGISGIKNEYIQCTYTRLHLQGGAGKEIVEWPQTYQYVSPKAGGAQIFQAKNAKESLSPCLSF